ncbi:hypothetical protein [Cytobacillus gottheilii]|uniref:hypothetical protein n=1 Tax=Cytobacillus gottheilii TaxID=859144 RepID=UPI0009BA99E0|nr:hypothetical protein [Cytobacillus gottheilii]
MDHQREKRTITIKINGEDRPFQVNKTDNSENKEEKKEPMESFASFQTAAAQEAETEDQFDWILPEEEPEEEVKEFNIASAPEKKKNTNGFKVFNAGLIKKGKKSFVPTFFFAVFFAVLLGTSFGFILLKLVIAEPDATASPAATNGGQSAEQPEQPAGTIQYEAGSLNTFIVQGGVFTTEEAVKQEQQKSLDKGVPASYIQGEENFPLFLAISDDLTKAKDAGAKLKEQGFQVFAKEITFGGNTLQGLTEDEKLLLEHIPNLFKSLTASASAAYSGIEIPADTAENTAAAGEILSSISDENIKQEKLILLKQELNSALSQFEAYASNPDAAASNKLQGHLLAFLAAYDAL